MKRDKYDNVKKLIDIRNNQINDAQQCIEKKKKNLVKKRIY